MTMPRRRFLLVPLFALTASGAMAQTSAPDAGKEASIPFVRLGQIYDFEADGDRGVYLQDRSRKWYYASIMGPCMNLPFVTRIGVKTRGLDSLDHFGSILVDGQDCKIDRLVTSGPPLKKAKKPKH
jgi:hypothetical protein